ncbi:PREDICTED: probable FBD-associated F-box protein At1g32375 [Camelina sativa]|uniref:Probable FBD-associated F-box protein At1g32375 n=1 Tax=Camelina sativa TaxID=90675 RepID=A0ABM0XFE8_CAMSA|nr:PREDICTED: probable FBD-associated F-box protein At1g32375 [Camelina sativa]
MAHMDRISHLPEELLLRISSLLPSKNVVVTMVLSKRWKFLWMLVPRLEYEHVIYRGTEDKSFSRFVYSFLLLHEAPVLESLRLRFNHSWKSSAIDIGVWVRTAVKRFVRELDIEIHSNAMKYPVILPWSLYSGGCRMLVTLKLNDTTLVHDSSLPASTFPSLKKLSLVNMKYPSEEFVNKLLSNCPVLEDLVVEQCPGDNLASVLTVKIPSLKRLCFRCKQLITDLNHEIDEEDKDCGIVIDAPLLESFSIFDDTGGLSIYVNSDCCIMNNMPKIVYANLNISYRIRNIMGSITSVKRLYLRLSTAENAYPVGSVYHRLVHLTLCICTTDWLKPLMCLLRDSPKLQVLKIEQCGGFQSPHFCWNEPNSSVPECVSSSLETQEWVQYEGSEEEKQVVAFILRNASCLKKATISSRSRDPVEKLEMLRELSFLSRCSSTCHLTFD